ncbi:LPS translocon maturation chaperone LptM [Oleiphilus messinensis]|nr:lipoprotein [Oleiphilus messinensis]
MKWGTVVFAGLLLVGCGQKGALYLPADTPDQKGDSVVQEELKETQTDGEPDSKNKGRS